MTKVDFLICGRRGFNVLKNFIETFGAEVINQVASYADKNVLNDPYEELAAYCKAQFITLCTKQKYTSTDSIFRLVIGWQYIIKADGKTIVLHDSLLPKYRGFAPLINCLIKGEKEVGVTAFIATNEYDEGPVISQESVAVNYPITILQAMELVTPLYCQVCDFIFKQLQEHGKLTATEQDHYLATYSLWRDEKDFSIDWNRPSDEIKRKIDAVGYPYKGAVTLLNSEPVTIRAAEIFEDVVIENRDIGKVIFVKNSCPVIVCNNGLIKITEAYFSESGKPVIPFSKIRSRFH